MENATHILTNREKLILKKFSVPLEEGEAEKTGILKVKKGLKCFTFVRILKYVKKKNFLPKRDDNTSTRASEAK